MALTSIRASLAAGLLVAFAQADAATMTAHFIDVGQGAATILEFSCGAVLIGSGGEQRDGLFEGRQKFVDYVRQFFTDRPQLEGKFGLIVLSHPHLDHISFISSLKNSVGNYPTKAVVDNGDKPLLFSFNPKNNQHRLQKWAQDNAIYLGVAVDDISDDGITDGAMDPFDCPGVDPKFSAIWGRTEVEPDNWSSTAFDNLNNHSVVLRVDFGAASFLFLGDLEKAGEPDMLVKYDNTDMLDVDVVQASHHGAENGTSQQLLDASTPKLIVVPVGNLDRRYKPRSAWDHGHPTSSAIARFVDKTTCSRTPIAIKTAPGQEPELTEIQSVTVSKAIYGTGWDGNVRVIADSDGTYKIESDDGIDDECS
jgi:beta-lactamase superfamily II metal-dependent hydrolase